MKKIKIDPISLTVQCATDLSWKRLQSELKRRGYSLGYEPIGQNPGNLKKILERRLPNRWGRRYGEIEEICVALLAETTEGRLRTKVVPRSSTGPDFKRILIGSEGRYGQIREVVLRIGILQKRKRIELPLSRISLKEFFYRLGASGVHPLALTFRGKRVEVILEGPPSRLRAEIQALKRLT